MKRVSYCVLFACLIFSCSKKGDPVQQSNVNVIGNANVYVIGLDDNGDPAYWKNGMETVISTGLISYVYAGFVSGTDVYIAGFQYKNGNVNVPTYFKNNTTVSLPFTGIWSRVLSIFVSGVDVYTAGYQFDGTSLIPMYWKNGAVVLLPHSGNSVANSIFISGNDVYIAGYDVNNFDKTSHKAVYWKNGIELDLSNSSAGSIASAIYVSGLNVYIIGGEINSCYWKNGTMTVLNGTNSTYQVALTSIFVKDNDVYVSGWQTNQATLNAVYWKNGSPVGLDEGTTANSIFVFGNDVFLVGTSIKNYPSPVYWKNDSMMTLPTLKNVGIACSIFVQ